MKYFYTLLLGFGSFVALSQVPQSINYQGVVRDADGIPVSTLSTIGVKFDISNGSSILVHQETQNAVPVNTLGIFNTRIGLSPALSNTINWANGPFTLSVSIDAGNGFNFMGSQQLASVPFALYALKAGDALPAGTKNGQTLRWNSGINSWEVDSNLTNDGSHVGIGLYPAGLQSRLHVTTNAPSDTSVIFGYHSNMQSKGAGLRGIVVGNTPLSFGDPFETAIYGGNHTAINQGNGLAIGNLGLGSSNGTSAGLLGIGLATVPTSTVIGLYATAVGDPGANKMAGLFDQGSVQFNDSIYITGTNLIGANIGNVLTLSSSGRAKWAPVPGGVSVINTSGPILGGPITSSGTISLQTSGVTPGTYGASPNVVPFFNVDTYGRVMSAGSYSLPSSVSSISTSAPLSGGPITSNGTISLLPSGVISGSYGAAPNTVPVFTVDTYGRLINAGSYSLAIPASTLSGDVTGTFLSNTVTAIRGFSVSPATPLAGQILQFSPSGVWTPTTLPLPPLATWIKSGSTVTLATNSDFVGVGAASPAEKLQVESTGDARISIISPAGSLSELWMGTPAVHNRGIIQYNNSTNEMNFGTNNMLNRMRILNNGNIAFGSTVSATPANSNYYFSKQGPSYTKVVISGGDNSNSYGGILSLGENASATQGMSFKLDAVWNTMLITTDINGSTPIVNIGGYSGATPGMLIGTSFAALGNSAPLNGLAVQGNVGIGTTTPAQMLDVNGSVLISGTNTNELQRTQTSDANLVPVAYANITPAGLVNASASTANVTLASHAAGSGLYYFNVGGESIYYLNHVVAATLVGTNGEIGWDSAGGQLLIRTFNSAGAPTDKPFTFVIYKK